MNAPSEDDLRDALHVLDYLAREQHTAAQEALDDGYVDHYNTAASRASAYLRSLAMIRDRIMSRQRDHVGPMPGVQI